MRTTKKNIRISSLLVAAALASLSLSAHAVPSFTRQTGMGCNSCHTIFPALTSFGRNFKLNGYTLQGVENKITTPPQPGAPQTLNIDKIPPFSAMVQASLTHTSKAQPVDSTTTPPGIEPAKNNDVLFPQQLSFFFAGEIAPKLGMFMQITYTSQDAKFDWDNTDIRFADHARLGASDLLYGLSLNNNPTVQDVWNTTPAWGFPYASSSVAPSPITTAIIDGALAQQVTGLTAYGLWNNLFYAEAGAYRSSPTGVERPLNGGIASDVIDGAAPYWRLAVQKDFGPHYLEIGTFGLAAKLYPGDGVPLASPTNDYTDSGVDLQYEFKRNDDVLTAHVTYIHEKQGLDASFLAGDAASPTNHLNICRLNASYYMHGRYGATLARFSTRGDTDGVLYAPAPLTGSATGSPDTRGLIGELDYLPWLNTKLSLQYVAYNKFNGAKTNYDGSGRDAKDNNTLYLLAWLLF